MTELERFVAAVLAEPDGAGALADWLEEHDDPRGALLRRRWKSWRTQRGTVVLKSFKKWRATGCTAEVAHAAAMHDRSALDHAFKAYIRERFAAEALAPLREAMRPVQEATEAVAAALAVGIAPAMAALMKPFAELAAVLTLPPKEEDK